MKKSICIVFPEECCYELLDTLISNALFENLFCVFFSNTSFIDENFYGDIVAFSQNNFKKYKDIIDTLYIYGRYNQNDTRVNDVIIAAKEQGIEIITNSSQRYSKDCFLLTQNRNTSAISILILNMCSNSGSLSFSMNLYNSLKKDYTLSIVSSDPAAVLFGFNYIDYDSLKNKNINSVYMRSFLNRHFNSIVNKEKSEILIYDFPFPILSPDIIAGESDEILFENLLNSIMPDYIIYMLPVNRAYNNYIDKISDFFLHKYLLKINSFIIYDRVFDEIQYSNSRTLCTFKSSDKTKSNMSKNYIYTKNTPVLCSWEQSTPSFVVNNIENHLGNGIEYRVL